MFASVERKEKNRDGVSWLPPLLPGHFGPLLEDFLTAAGALAQVCQAVDPPLALATIDRDYGILNKVFHHISDTHVLHHLISTIPHYHAEEATEAIKPVLGDYYHYDGTSFYKAMWREAKECLYVEEEDGDKSKGVYWYKNKL